MKVVLILSVLWANRPLLPLVRIRAYVGGSLCGLLLDRGRQYVISEKVILKEKSKRDKMSLFSRI
uniref:Uncharacterized protein n=1 Tax=Magallana gigas TaxID=29159 RepID=K1QH39_MAGGI